MKKNQIPEMEINVANDLGNGRTKMYLDSNMIIVPSARVNLTRKDYTRARVFNDPSEKAKYIKNLLNELEVSIVSNAVYEDRRMLVGNSTRKLSNRIKGFDVNDLSGKAGEDLHLILTLSSIAGYAVIRHFQKTKELPTELNLNINMSVALPISDGKDEDKIQTLHDRYKNGVHTVVIHNFLEIIRVNIKFEEVIVSLEGEAAQYALASAPKELEDALKEELDKNYPALAEEFTAEDIIFAENTIGIDIGEGTVDIPVFTEGELNIKASDSMKDGYGTVLEEAINYLQHNRNIRVGSRSQLQDIILNGNEKKIRFYNEAVEAVEDQLEDFSERVIETVSKALRDSSSMTQFIFVYGGGSVATEASLRLPLMRKTQHFTGQSGIPVLFVPEKYAQILNLLGLKIILDTVLEAKAVEGVK